MSDLPRFAGHAALDALAGALRRETARLLPLAAGLPADDLLRPPLGDLLDAVPATADEALEAALAGLPRPAAEEAEPGAAPRSRRDFGVPQRPSERARAGRGHGTATPVWAATPGAVPRAAAPAPAQRAAPGSGPAEMTPRRSAISVAALAQPSRQVLGRLLAQAGGVAEPEVAAAAAPSRPALMVPSEGRRPAAPKLSNAAPSPGLEAFAARVPGGRTASAAPLPPPVETPAPDGDAAPREAARLSRDPAAAAAIAGEAVDRVGTTTLQAGAPPAATALARPLPEPVPAAAAVEPGGFATAEAVPSERPAGSGLGTLLRLWETRDSAVDESRSAMERAPAGETGTELRRPTAAGFPEPTGRLPSVTGAPGELPAPGFDERLERLLRREARRHGLRLEES